ncbi:hypothetical protein H8356DRAFT_1323208 [Neocallimastix lanati (nom. inval.)]|nr:hypothetical protein H8356DRAFT_1323208 [Neocallimastix sp. JGI-2020a]
MKQENLPAVLLGDFNMPLDKLKKYIIKNFPDWTVATLTGSSNTYSKGSKSFCIDRIIYNKAMIPHVYLFSACSFANDISNHYPFFLSFNKNLSDVRNLEFKFDETSADDMNQINSSLLIEIMPGAGTRQGLLFRKYKRKLTRASILKMKKEDHNFFQIVNLNPNPKGNEF